MMDKIALASELVKLAKEITSTNNARNDLMEKEFEKFDYFGRDPNKINKILGQLAKKHRWNMDVLHKRFNEFARRKVLEWLAEMKKLVK